MSTDKPTIKFAPRHQGKSITQQFGVDEYAARQVEQIRKSLEDTLIAETTAKLSSILKDPKHPAHHKVRRLVLEAQNATTSTR